MAKIKIQDGTLNWGRVSIPASKLRSVEVGYYGNGPWYWPVNFLILLFFAGISAYSSGGRWQGNAPGGVLALTVITVSIILFLRRLQNLLIETVRLTVYLADGSKKKATFDSYKEADEIRNQLNALIVDRAQTFSS